MRNINWEFDGSPTFDGYTDGTFWNGFLNVWVTPQEHLKVVAYLEGDDEASDQVTIDEFKAMEPAPHKDHNEPLISYAYGYTALEVIDA